MASLLHRICKAKIYLTVKTIIYSTFLYDADAPQTFMQIKIVIGTHMYGTISINNMLNMTIHFTHAYAQNFTSSRA